MEGTGDEVIVAAEGAHLKRKESDPSSKLDCCNLMESPAMVLPTSKWPDTVEGELKLKKSQNSNLARVDSSTRMEKPRIRLGRWQHLYQLAGGSVNGSSHGDTMSKDKEPVASDGLEDMRNLFLPEFQVENPLPGKQCSQDRVKISERSISSDMNTISNKILPPRRTPENILTKSGFSQFFSKNTLKAKGLRHMHPKTDDGFGAVDMGQVNEKATFITRGASNVSLNPSAKPDDQSLHRVARTGPVLFHDGISLREWLKPGCRKVNKAESLCIFRQIVELVDLAHSRQVALQDLMPSCFKLFPSSRIKYVGSLAQKELLGSVMDQGIPFSEHHMSRKMCLEQDAHAHSSLCSKRQKLGDNMKFVQQHPGLPASSDFKCKTVNEVGIHRIGTQDYGYDTSEKHNLTPDNGIRNRSGSPSVYITAQQQIPSVDLRLEKKWYTSPEEFNEQGFSFSSNIYSLGILLFELFCCSEAWEVHAAAMSDLRHRILSPMFLSENPKEAGFCLWLLHPEPSSRPTTREVLQSELLCESQELSSMDQLSLSVYEDEVESELLLHFLSSLKEQKQKRASKLIEDIGCLETDVQEVEQRHLVRAGAVLSCTRRDSSNARELGYAYKEPLGSVALMSNMNEARLLRNMNQLENAYFSMRSQIQLPETDTVACMDGDLLKNRKRCSLLQNEKELVLNQKPIDRLGAFYDGLCKYARYSKFEVCSTLRTGDLINSANVICSLSFDRDEDYFAAAGVSKKIKIFEFRALLNGSVDIHYPVMELSSNSKLSCVCWNNYIKNYLASTDYDGEVQLWDASTGQLFSQYMEHEKRAWSVDFSQLDPTKLASGSDDCSVKLWSINEQKCISTIRSIANVCCVQFSRSSHLLAFGSADYKTYCYDLRLTRSPWCTLPGHGKAVSYLKFLDSETLVSASTDNTLKLWDLNKTSFSGLSNGSCSLTFTGHTNEKNFVGLSVSDGYIACGSETNEVYAYYRSLPMPITSHKFGSIDPISGKETENDNGLFVSSVCWREKSKMVVAANSSGSIKLLQMV